MNHRCNRNFGGPYRSRCGLFFGVCRGLADHFDFSAFWLRAIVVIAAFMTGFVPVLVGYLLVALLMKLAPVLPLENNGDAEFYNSYTSSRPMALSRLKSTFESLDRRIQRMEDIVTARDYDWDERLRSS